MLNKDFKKMTNRKKSTIILLLVLFSGVLFLCFLASWFSTSANEYLITKFLPLNILLVIMIVFWTVFLSGLYYLSGKIRLNRPKIFFYGFIFLGIIGIFIASFLSRGEAFRSMLFTDKTDMFMDFFEIGRAHV